MAEETKGKWAWEDYPEVEVRGNEEIPDVSNQQRVADINKYLEVANEELDPAVEYGNKLAKPFRALGYGVRKYITDPVYKGVDVIAQKGGNKIAEMFGANLSDKDKYGDIDFGPNGERQGFDSLDEYINAKEQGARDYYNQREALDDPMAWYADAQGGDVLSEPSDPDSRWASLTGTKAYQDWQPETMVGKVAKGASGIAGDMLPATLEGYAIEKAPQLVMGALAPMYRRIVSEREEVNRLREAAKAETNPTRKAKIEATANKYERQYFRDKRDLEEATLNQRYAKKVVKPEEYNKAKATLSTEEFDTYTKDIGSGEYSNGSLRGRFAPTHKKLEDYENQSLAKMMRERAARGENPIPEYEVDDLGEYTGDYAKYFERNLEPAEEKAILRSIRKGEPKPLPNPAEQSRLAKHQNAINNWLKDEEAGDLISLNGNGVYQKEYGKVPRWWSQDYSFKSDPAEVIQDTIANSKYIDNFYDIPTKKQAEGIINQLRQGIDSGELNTDGKIIKAFDKLLADWWGYEL